MLQLNPSFLFVSVCFCGSILSISSKADRRPSSVLGSSKITKSACLSVSMRSLSACAASLHLFAALQSPCMWHWEWKTLRQLNPQVCQSLSMRTCQSVFLNVHPPHPILILVWFSFSFGQWVLLMARVRSVLCPRVPNVVIVEASSELLVPVSAAAAAAAAAAATANSDVLKTN